MTTQTRNVLGPLTTTFTPAPNCVAPLVYCPETERCYGWGAQTCMTTGVDNTGCWPTWTAGASVPTRPVALDGFGIYSPGLICPYGNTAACSATFAGAADFQFQYPLMESETAVGCCPQGYGCVRIVDGILKQTCTWTASSTSYSALVCSGLSLLPTQVFLPGSFTQTGPEGDKTEMFISSQTLWAPLFQLVWKASDVPSSSEASSTSAAETSRDTASPGETSAGVKSTGVAAAGEDNGGLSIGAKAGIGAGAGVVALLLLGALLWWWRSKRRTKLAYEDVPGSSPECSGFKAELQANDAPVRTELPINTSASPSYAELPTKPAQTQEMQPPIWELESVPYVPPAHRQT
ncbi:hypothetical protein TWF281_001158 [Arthrobotrys megalospora]